MLSIPKSKLIQTPPYLPPHLAAGNGKNVFVFGVKHISVNRKFHVLTQCVENVGAIFVRCAVLVDESVRSEVSKLVCKDSAVVVCATPDIPDVDDVSGTGVEKVLPF